MGEETENWATGIVTAIKSGNSFHFVCPKSVEK